MRYLLMSHIICVLAEASMPNVLRSFKKQWNEIYLNITYYVMLYLKTSKF